MQQLDRIRPIRFIVIALTSALILLLWVVAAPISPSVGQPHSSTFEKVWQTVNDNFYDPDFNGVSWTDIKAAYSRSLTRLNRRLNSLRLSIRCWMS